jgi:hypothetical protein
MNIADQSSVTSWSNTTSVEFDSTAKNTYSYHDLNLGNNTWNYSLGSINVVDLPIKADTPTSLMSTLVVSDQPGSYSWPLWMFYAVAGALTFGSVILPLVSGRIYRYVVRLSIQKRRMFRTIVSSLWLMLVNLSIFFHHLLTLTIGF